MTLLISSAYAQNSLKSDFNNDGKIDFDDFFLFADAYQKCNSNENICDVKFDLDFNYNIDVEDFFIFAEEFGKKTEVKKFNVGENCKEVIQGFNGPVNERINLVFLSFNYDSIDTTPTNATTTTTATITTFRFVCESAIFFTSFYL